MRLPTAEQFSAIIYKVGDYIISRLNFGESNNNIIYIYIQFVVCIYAKFSLV